MRNLRSAVLTAAACTLAAGVCLADATVEHKVQMHFGGALGGVINVFGGKATHEGASSTTYLKGNRKATAQESTAEIVDLDEEKIYHVDFGRKSYKVVTFDELRKQFEEQKERAEKQAAREQKSEKKEGPEYEVDFDVRNTGEKQAINGFNTHQVIVTVTVREKGKKLEQSGGAVLTNDLWMGPKLSAMNEINSFDRRYFEKLYGTSFAGADMQQLAVLLATNPAFGKAMKTLSQKQASLEGTAIKTNMTFETVAGTEQKASAKDDDSGGGLSAGSIVGGFMKRAQQKRQAEKGESASRSKLFDSSFEVTKAAANAATSDVSIPAGFTQSKR